VLLGWFQMQRRGGAVDDLLKGLWIFGGYPVNGPAGTAVLWYCNIN